MSNRYLCNKCGKEITINSKSGLCQSCSLKGRKLTEKHKLNISKSRKNMKLTKKHRKNISKSRKGQKISEETKKKLSKSMIIPGLDRNYPLEFKLIKPVIRERDNYICQNPECNKTQLENKRALSVHHIDYNKFNLNPNNLISLCVNCHAKTYGNRDYWYAYFTYIMENKK